MAARRNPRIVVKFPVFGYEITVIRAACVKRTGHRLGVDCTHAEAAFISGPDHPLRGWLVLGPDPNEGVVAHEASHAIRKMFEDVGAGLDDEVFAYHLDHLVTRIHRFLKRTTT